MNKIIIINWSYNNNLSCNNWSYNNLVMNKIIIINDAYSFYKIAFSLYNKTIIIIAFK